MLACIRQSLHMPLLEVVVLQMECLVHYFVQDRQHVVCILSTFLHESEPWIALWTCFAILLVTYVIEISRFK